jgi:phospholipid:diacylglycerol acyltransferase
VVITSHSWGEAVVRNFFWWVERKSRGWTEKHVAAYVNIAGTVLGVPKVQLAPCMMQAC